ncbi:prepilin peptidase [Massilia sp. YIM B02769]|uniref:A24 family peptidase n=1 Tax=unclassified Massilia TaxID=2609279 RepID=UPI0025B72EB0|nr:MULTISPECIES: prepilin peptidase [unclassified Massilia]MDN4057032.1 prepilin peptidase [Massilia sp. YIM B02769]
MPVQTWLDLMLLVLVVSAAITDLAFRKIPNLLLLAAWCGVFGLHLAGATPAGSAATALGGAATGFALFIPLYALRGMAAGDVKLMATVGLFFGAGQTVHACILAWCLGGVMALAMILVTGRWQLAWAGLRKLFVALLPLPLLAWLGVGPAPQAPAGQSAGSIPYGLAIALGALWLLARRHYG